jgi:hypothetical protein
VIARFSPTSKADVSTMDGIRGGPRHVLGELAQAAHEVLPARVDRHLQHGGVEHGVVARRRRVEQVLGHEAHAALGLPVQVGVADELVDRPARRQVGLDDPAQGGLPAHAGSWKRRSLRSGSSSDRPATTLASSKANPAVRRVTARGRVARRPASLTPASPGHQRCEGPPAAASVSSSSSPW